MPTIGSLCTGIGGLDLAVEWLCGFEPGWITDVVSSRVHALRLLGNSVCPPQAELALALLT